MKLVAKYSYPVECRKCGAPQKIIVAPNLGSAQVVEFELDDLDLERLMGAVYRDTMLSHLQIRDLMDRLYGLRCSLPKGASLVPDTDQDRSIQIHDRAHMNRILDELNKKVPSK